MVNRYFTLNLTLLKINEARNEYKNILEEGLGKTYRFNIF